MRRRSLRALLSGLAFVLPLAAHAQAPLPVIGFLSSISPAPASPLLAAFRQGLARHGYVEDRTVAIEYRWAEGRYERLPGLAADLVGRRVAVIAATGGLVTAKAAKAATTS